MSVIVTLGVSVRIQWNDPYMHCTQSWAHINGSTSIHPSSFYFLEAGRVMHMGFEIADFVCPSHLFNFNSSVIVFIVKTKDL